MNKTAALNKLATAVREYIAAEQAYTKVASAMQQLQLEKAAGIQKQAQMMDKIKGMLGMTPPPAPKGMGGGAKALLGLLGAGGAGAGAYALHQHPELLEKLKGMLGMGGDTKAPFSLNPEGPNSGNALLDGILANPQMPSRGNPTVQGGINFLKDMTKADGGLGSGKGILDFLNAASNSGL